MCDDETTFSALRNSKARPGDLIAIQGIGGLGHLAVQYAKKAGFRTFSHQKRLRRSNRMNLKAHFFTDTDVP
ncbi:hypothetical protein J7E95_00675 [Streptomyces sp. ISL-14]|uniref:hypothetical protein n=1 Tax=Bacillus sp. ISL-4 TaxID=2819125 RepID=UPI001C133272|nr:hypothetical protein [Bacillus sp. ISL-4]MBT2669303.1 hypothetical protein [Streptomyces sp. ISL-14]